MSDITAADPYAQPVDQLAEYPSAPYSLVGVDRKLNRIGGIEQTWALPAIPDEVKYDLASRSDHDENSLSEFLFGIAGDVNRAINPLSATPAEAAPFTPELPPLGPTFQAADSPANRLRTLWAGIANIDPPEIADLSAVRRAKTRAVAKGLLPASTPLDGSWGPEQHEAFIHLLQEEKRDAIAGDRPGSTSWHWMGEQLDKWFSPSGLLTIATKMDFLPDLGAGEREWADWGDKWRRWHTAATSGASNVDRARLFWDALTGPIDDAVVPVINDLLLVTGVGEIVAVARGGEVTAQGLKGLYTFGRFTKGYDAAADVANLGKAGLGSSLLSRGALGIGTKLENVAPRTALGLRGLSSQMDKWRAIKAVQLSKKVVGIGMRQGQVGLLEHALNPSAAYVGGIDDYLEQRAETSITGRFMADLALTPFTPTSIWRPGGFKRVLGKATTATIENTALKVLRDTNAKATNEIVEGLLDAPPEAWRDPARQVHFQQRVREIGHTQALAELAGGEERAGGLVSYLTLMTGIDAHALAKANEAVNGTQSYDPGEWAKVFHTFRSQKLAAIKQVDPDDPDEVVRTVKRLMSGRKGNKWEARTRALLDSGDAPTLAELRQRAVTHNEMAVAQFNDLLRTVTPGQVRAHVSNFVRNFEAWDEFVASMDDLENWAKGADLSGIRFAEAWSPSGRRLAVNHVADDVQEWITATLKDGVAGVEKPSVVPKSWFQPLGGDMTGGWSDLTLATLDTPTKQEMIAFLGVVRHNQKRLTALQYLERKPEMLQAFLDADIGSMKGQELTQWIEASFAQKNIDRVKSAAYSMLEASKQGIDQGVVTSVKGKLVADLSAAKLHFQTRLDELGRHEAWADRYRIGDVIRTKDGKLVAADLDGKVSKLRRLINYTAADLGEGIPEALKAKLAERGYKVVKGVGPWAAPSDVLRQVHPFVHLTNMDRRVLSLGAFVDKVDDSTVMAVQAHKLRDSLVRSLVEDGHLAAANAFSVDGNPATEVDFIVGELRNYLQKRREVSQAAVSGAEKTGHLAQRLGARFLAAGVPANVRDLSMKDLKVVFQDLYDDAKLRSIYKAIRQSFPVGFRMQGLGHLEDSLRARNQVSDFLNLFSRTVPGTKLGRLRSAGVRAGVGAGIGAAYGVVIGDGDVLDSAAMGAATGLTLGSPRGLSAVAGGIVGATAGSATGLGPVGTIAGAALGGLKGPSAAGGALRLFEDSKYYQYGYLAEGLSRLRTYFRFNLSPFFDLSRYTEGMVMAQTRDLKSAAGTPINLPFNLSPSAYVKQHGEEGLSRAMATWRNAGHGVFEQATALEDTERFFTQVGIMGFNPTKWQATTYQHLLDQGMEAPKAFETTRRIYGYGLGRSPLEKSVNFIWFPFSFIKKYNTDIATYLADDLTRLMVVHDGLKGYELLDQEYDLTGELQKHMPMLDNLRKFNNLLYGLNPGEFGGINRPILNLFSPQGVFIDDRESQKRFETAVRRAMPAINDVNRLLDTLEEQGHVMFNSPTHQTRRSEIDEAYGQWNEYKRAADQEARKAGYESGWASIMRDGDLEAFKDEVKRYRAELGEKYPSWQGAQAEGTARRIRTRTEIDQRYQVGTDAVDQDLRAFVDYTDSIAAVLAEQGISVGTEQELVPPEIYDVVRNYALQLAARGNGFESLYGKYWARDWGPIVREVA